MHDGGLGGGNPDRSVTVHALPRILAGLRDAGYAMVTVPELMRAKVAACSAN
jgi:peptidoglycan/xylan/chitin deacetylase (PgdA/CDA1 family)